MDSHQAPPPSAPRLSELLTKEHHEIDAGIEAFIASSEANASVRQWAKPLTDAMSALRRHIYIEEALVFPKISTGGLMMAVMVMLREHGEIWRAMDQLDEQLAAPAVDEEPTRSAVIGTCRQMLSLLEAHNQKEEPVIYPHLDTDLDDRTRNLLDGFLKEGDIPDGWVCEHAAGAPPRKIF